MALFKCEGVSGSNTGIAHHFTEATTSFNGSNDLLSVSRFLCLYLFRYLSLHMFTLYFSSFKNFFQFLFSTISFLLFFLKLLNLLRNGELYDSLHHNIKIVSNFLKTIDMFTLLAMPVFNFLCNFLQ